MFCPYCGAEMEEGQVEGGSRGSLVWISKEAGRFLGLFAIESIKLNPGFFTGTYCIAHHCRECRKIIIDVPEQRN